ncbi:MAG TPA: helix-turn-helix domain-containing protein [Patescibacteria group bacterium]|nr:helix-turn-helix domain-containing protein [Patescibacteria group bacterium]
MMNSKDTILHRLQGLGLESDEAQVFLELLKGPATHLKLARATGINRSKVYRLASELEKRSLISVRSDDRGTFLIASDPATLEVELVTQEEKIKNQRESFESLMPVLELIRNNDASGFIVHTYEGEEGFKQMMWHELKTKGENVMFGCGSLKELVNNKRWVEQHQKRMLEANYSIREIINPGETDKTFTINTHYKYRTLSRDILPLDDQIATYNDTVAIYHWRQDQKVGIEIINQGYARTTRKMFETYWGLAQTFSPHA